MALVPMLDYNCSSGRPLLHVSIAANNTATRHTPNLETTVVLTGLR